MSIQNQPDPFYQQNPLALSFSNVLGEAKMFISDRAEDGRVTIQLKNVSERPIFLAHGSGAAASGNHHVALHFKPGVLSAQTKTSLKQNKTVGDWAVRHQKTDYFDTFYLLYTKANGDGRTKLAKSKALSLSLTGFTAEAAGGARGSREQLSTNPKMVS